MRAPSRPIQHSSTPALKPGKPAENSSRSPASTAESFFADNSFPTARFYLSEHRLCSLHLGSFGSPFFPFCHPERSISFAHAKLMRSRRIPVLFRYRRAEGISVNTSDSPLTLPSPVSSSTSSSPPSSPQ